MSDKHLGQFGHHPEPDQDFLIEREVIEGMACDVALGLPPHTKNELLQRLERVSVFCVVLPDYVAAKNEMKKFQAHFSPTQQGG